MGQQNAAQHVDDLDDAVAFDDDLAVMDERCNAVVDLQEKKYVYGIKGLASLLGCSIATAERVKASGILNPAISQHGRTIIIDAEMALDILRISGKHKYILSKMRKEQ